MGWEFRNYALFFGFRPTVLDATTRALNASVPNA